MCEVLIVDNDPAFLKSLSKVLVIKKTKVETCRSVKDALDIETETLPLVMILDFMLPTIDGLKLLEKIKSHPVTSEIYVIMTATPEDNDSMSIAYNMGADEFFCKTSGLRALMFRVGKVLEYQKRLRENGTRD